MKPSCWFRGRPGTGPCGGRLDPAHWIKQQVLRREVGVTAGDEALWDPRVWTPMCRNHHVRLDKERSLRVARADLPPGVEEYARERDAAVPGDREPLGAWLDMEYGQRDEEKAA